MACNVWRPVALFDPGRRRACDDALSGWTADSKAIGEQSVMRPFLMGRSPHVSLQAAHADSLLCMATAAEGARRCCVGVLAARSSLP
jgi:hypothetical protein